MLPARPLGALRRLARRSLRPSRRAIVATGRRADRLQPYACVLPIAHRSRDLALPRCRRSIEIICCSRDHVRRPMITISDDEALAIPRRRHLPVYTVSAAGLRRALDRAEPRSTASASSTTRTDKLEILLLIEEDDAATADSADRHRTAVHAGRASFHDSLPEDASRRPATTACRCLTCDGEFITIYDAEDIPDPLQLRRAVAAFAEQPADSRLPSKPASATSTRRQNLLTRWFSLEYDQWFGYDTAALCEATECVVPLGGTSNHMRTAVLARRRRLGRVQRHRGRRPRRPTRPPRISHADPRLDHTRGSQFRRHQLDSAAIPLVQGLSADDDRAPAPSGPVAPRDRHQGHAATDQHDRWCPDSPLRSTCSSGSPCWCGSAGRPDARRSCCSHR